MKKLFKILKWFVGVFLLVLILGIVGLYLFFPIDKVKQMAVDEGSERLGRPINIGDAQISIWGGVGVRLSRVTIANPDNSFERDILKADEIDLKLQLWPIFKGEYRIDKLIINQPDIYLKKNKDGYGNFSFETLTEDIPPEIAEKTPREAAPALAAISFDNLEINSGKLVYIDDSADFYIKLDDFNLETSLENPSSGLFNSKGKIDIKSVSLSRSDSASYKVILGYDAVYDLTNDKLALSQSDLSVNDLNLIYSGTIDKFLDSPKAYFKLSSNPNSLKQLKSFLDSEYAGYFEQYQIDGSFETQIDLAYYSSQAAPLTLTGRVTVTNGSANPGEPYEKIDSFETVLAFDEKSVKVEKLEALSKSNKINLSGQLENLIAYFLADETVQKEITPKMNLDMSGDVNLTHLSRYLPEKGNPQLDGEFLFDMKITGPVFDYMKLRPKGKFTIKNASYSDSLLPEPIKQFNAVMTATYDTINVEKMEVKFQSSDASFSGKLTNPFPYFLPFDDIDRDKVKKPDFLFTLNSKRFDFDRLFPEAVPGSYEGKPSISADSVSMIIIPDINGRGTFRIDSMIYSRVEFANIKGDVMIRERKIECYNVTGDVYNGNVSGKTTIDLTNFNLPVYSGEFKAEKIEANEFISRFTKFKNYLYGKVDFSGSYQAKGWDPDAFLNSLSMNSTSSMKEGKVVTSGAVYEMMSGLAKKSNQTFEKEQPLKNLITNIVVKDGKVATDNFKTKLGDFGDFEIGGFYSFNDDISYQGTILLSESQTQKLLSNKGLLGGLSSLLNDKSTKRIKLPLAISGTVDKPKFEIDYSTLSKDVGKNLKEEAGDLLNNLFKKKK